MAREALVQNYGPKVVTIGGGTGTFTVNTSLRQHLNYITSIVSVADDGGSSGRLKKEQGMVPPGDVRQALAALANAPELMRQMLDYRFSRGDVQGHNLGNLILAGMVDITGSVPNAIAELGRMFNVSGRVIPVALETVDLCLRLPDGTIVQGEAVIGEECAGKGYFQKGLIPDLYLTPEAQLNPEARQAIMEADIVVVCPGKLYSSIAPNLLVPGMSQALQKTDATIVYVCNLMTQVGQTDGFGVQDFAEALEAIAGGPFIDVVLYNTATIAPHLLQAYAKQGEEVIQLGSQSEPRNDWQLIGLPLVSAEFYTPAPGDALDRTLIRHDTKVLGRALMRILYSA